jgi:hypothetical protein
MGVYEDMACDAGCPYGSEENAQMAQMIYQDEEQHYNEQLAEREYEAWLESCFEIWRANTRAAFEFIQSLPPPSTERK